MAQTRRTPTPRAPVSPSTSPDGSTVSQARETSFPSSHTPTNSAFPGVLEAPITPSSSPLASNMAPSRRAGSKALPSSRTATSSSSSPPKPTSVTEGNLTMNDITAKIPHLLPHGYYQCAGQSTSHSCCRRQIKNASYCHSHSTQLLEAISHNKKLVAKTIIQLKTHKGPIEDKIAEIACEFLLCRHWTKTHVKSFENLLRNIKKGPLRAEERDQGIHALVPRWDRVYVCRGRTQVGRSCNVKTVGAFYCRYHDPLRITAGDVEKAFAAIWSEGGLSSGLLER